MWRGWFVSPPAIRRPDSHSDCYRGSRMKEIKKVVLILGCIFAVVLGLGLISNFASSGKKQVNARPIGTPKEDTAALAAQKASRLQSLSIEMARTINSLGARKNYAEQILRDYPGTPQADQAAIVLKEIQEELVGSQWSYWSDEDPMTSKVSRGAKVQSTNSFEFDFPYKGTQHAALMLRKHPSYGSDVMFSVERGQILCSSYQCPVRIRFDDAPAVTYVGTGPADNSSETVFIPGFASLEKKSRQPSASGLKSTSTIRAYLWLSSM